MNKYAFGVSMFGVFISTLEVVFIVNKYAFGISIFGILWLHLVLIDLSRKSLVYCVFHTRLTKKKYRTST